MNTEDLELLHESLKTKDRDGNWRTPKPPPTAIRLLEETCERTGLNWKLRHVYLVERGGKWSVTLSIDGFRLIANNDPEYNGQAGPLWTLGPDKPWTDIPPDKAPYAARVGVYRKGQAEPTWGVAKFSDYDAGTPMWRKFSSTMIAKCAEMLGLRKALPGKLGGLYGAEEMDQAGKVAGGKDSDVKKRTEFKSEQQPTDSWESMIRAAGTTEALKEIGKKIQALPLDEKLRLNAAYWERKTTLAEEGK